jgi:hypothetical protein
MQRLGTVTVSLKKSFEFYETPPIYTKTLLYDIGTIVNGKIFECCSGDNAIANVLMQNGYHVTTNDIDRNRKADRCMDASKDFLWMSEPCDWVISNPPFNKASSIVKHAFHYATCGVAFLLRLTFLEPCLNRAEFLVNHPPSILVMPRHSFTGDGNVDSVTCAWFIWIKKEKQMGLKKPHSTVRIISRKFIKRIENDC